MHSLKITINTNPDLDPEMPANAIQLLRELSETNNIQSNRFISHLLTIKFRAKVWAKLYCSHSMLQAILETASEAFKAVEQFSRSRYQILLSTQLLALRKELQAEINNRQKTYTDNISSDHSLEMKMNGAINVGPCKKINATTPGNCKPHSSGYKKGYLDKVENYDPNNDPENALIQTIWQIKKKVEINANEIQTDLISLRMKIWRFLKRKPAQSQEVIVMIKEMQGNLQNYKGDPGVKLVLLSELEKIIVDIEGGVFSSN